MKKILVIILMIFIVGCSQVSEEQKAYDKYFNILIHSETFTPNKQLPFDLNINVNKNSIKEFHYEFIITNPQIEFESLKIAILPFDFQKDEIIPTFNIIEEVDITLFNQNKSGIKLNYFSQYNYNKFKVLIEYNNQQQIFLIEK